MNPCQYSVSTLKAFGLQADDIIKYFANLIKRSIWQCFKDSPKFSYSPSEPASELMKDPMCILFNTIFMTLHYRIKKNEFGYAFVNSSILTHKIWALANDWEALLIHNPDHQNAN